MTTLAMNTDNDKRNQTNQNDSTMTTPIWPADPNRFGGEERVVAPPLLEEGETEEGNRNQDATENPAVRTFSSLSAEATFEAALPNCNMETNPIDEMEVIQHTENSSQGAQPPVPALIENVPGLPDDLPTAAGAGCLGLQASNAPFCLEQISSSSSSSTGVPHSDGCSRIALQWNINGLFNNLADLELLVGDNPPLTLALQEIHRPPTSRLERILQGQYEWHVKCGVNRYQNAAIAVHTSAPYSVINLETDLLAVAVRLHVPFPVTVVSVYLPSTGQRDLEEKLEELVNQLQRPMIILGDFNAHHYAWGSPTTDKRGGAVMQALQKVDATVLNDGSTTFLRGNTQSHIDISAASSEILPSLSWTISSDLHGSDHFPIEVRGCDQPPETTRRPKWRLDEANWEQYEDEIISTFDPNVSYNPVELTQLIWNAAKKCIPRTSSKPGKKAVHWWSDEVKLAIKNRRKALRRSTRLPDDHPEKQAARERFRVERGKSRRCMRKAKAKSWETFIEGINDSTPATEMWRRVNALSGKRRIRGMAINDGTTVSRDPVHVSNGLAEYFREISSLDRYDDRFTSSRYANNCPAIDNPIPDLEPEAEYNQPFQLGEMLFALDSAKGKSAGPDEISYPLLKRLPLRGKVAVLETMNGIWSSKSYPDAWKESLVVPIPKRSAGSSDPKNYRPIALTSCISKVMERMVVRRLTTILHERNLLDERQHAFRKGRGTGTYMATLGQVIDDSLKEGLHMDIAALDLAKAYNRVWRPGVIKQLLDWGISGNLTGFVQGFLQDRSFRVIVGNQKSRKLSEETGVPQGSVLAVTLFLIAMNGVFEVLPKGVYIFVYADDIVLLVAGKSPKLIRRKLQAAVRAVAKWAERTGFTMAAEKCAITHVCCQRHHPWLNPVTVRGDSIPYKKELKILGVVIDRRASFEAHYKMVRENSQQRSRLVQTITRRNPSNNRRTALRISSAIITSKLMYGIELTCRTTERMILRLGPIYNKAIRAASGMLPSTPALTACVEADEFPFEFLVTRTLAFAAISFLEKTSGDDCNVYIKNEANRRMEERNVQEIPRIAELCSVFDRKWNLSPIKVDWTIKHGIRAGDAPGRVAAVVGSVLEEKFPNHLKLYTDGSKAMERVGFGVSGPRISTAQRLPDHLSVFSAEAYAILHVITNIERTHQPVLILSDSASVLAALENPRCRHPFIQEIQENCSANTTLTWIPGHCGIKGNEDADRLACSGRTARMIATGTPAQDAKRKIERELLHQLQRKWHAESTSPLGIVKKDIARWEDRTNRKEQRTLTRLRVGHTKLTHQHCISTATRPLCEPCGMHITVEHLLNSCQIYAALREELEIEADIGNALSNDAVDEEKMLVFTKAAGIFDKI